MNVPHNLIAIDLAMHQTGITVFESTNDELTQWKIHTTITIKDLLNGEKFQEGSTRQLGLAFETLMEAYHAMNYCDIIWVEYNGEEINKSLEKFQLCIGSMLFSYKSATEFVNATHWMALADKYAPEHRKTFPAGREGNKKWIRANCLKLFPDYKFNSQDEMDSTLMGWTMIQDYLSKGRRL